MLLRSRSKCSTGAIWRGLDNSKKFVDRSIRFDLLFVPSGVVYEIFDLFILVDGTFQCFCLVQQWPVEAENFFAWTKWSHSTKKRKKIHENEYKEIATANRCTNKKKTKSERKICLPSANFGFGGILAVIVAAFYVILILKFCVCFALDLLSLFLVRFALAEKQSRIMKIENEPIVSTSPVSMFWFFFGGLRCKIVCDKMEKNVVRYSLNATRKPESTENCGFSMVNCQSVMEQCNRCGEHTRTLRHRPRAGQMSTSWWTWPWHDFFWIWNLNAIRWQINLKMNRFRRFFHFF